MTFCKKAEAEGNPEIYHGAPSAENGAVKHEPDGRVILAEFKSFCLLNTYVPNNGWKDEELGFVRRRAWDRRMLDFVKQSLKKPLIWCGDLNVSHEDIDVSHPDFFHNAKQQGYTPPMPRGNLVDTYRWLHKEQEFDSGFTWSGNPVGKYRGKCMRIDYFLLSRELLGYLISSNVHGHGIEQEGFYGSDHCPITMELAATLQDSTRAEALESEQADVAET